MSQRIVVTRIGNTLEWAVPTVGTIRLDVGALDDATRDAGLFHGFKQKGSDAAAIQYRRPDGTMRAPSWREKYDAISAVVANLKNGVWSGRESAVGVFYRALVEFSKGKFATAADARSYVEKRAAEMGTKPGYLERDMLNRSPELAAIVARMESENVDEDRGNELIAEILGTDEEE